MKPLLRTVVALCLLLATQAHPENIEQVKELPQKSEPVVEAEESSPQVREERCTTCKGGVNLKFKSPNEVLAAIQALPGAEVHSQSSFESCSSDKGCAGLKVKDGRVIERFGNIDAFKEAAASDTGNEFTFHAAGSLGNVFEGGIPKDGPFWWMNQNSPFKNGAAGGGGSFEKFSQSSSSFTSSGNAGGAGGVGSAGGAGGAGLGGGVSFDLNANPFLNGEFSKLAGSAAGFGASAQGGAKPAGSGFQSSSFESSSSTFSSNGGEIDLKSNPFLNGQYNKNAAGSGFQAGFSAGSAGQGAGAFGATGQGSQGAGQFGAQGSQFGAQGSQSSFGSSSSGQSAFGTGSRGSGAGFGASGSFGAGSGQGAAGQGFGASSGQSGASGNAGQGAQGFGQGFNGGSGQSAFSSQSSQSSFQGQGFGQGQGNRGYTGSSPSPFTASTAGSNVNLIQNTQKTSEFDFEQQQQTQSNIDEAFQGTGNVQSHAHSGSELQQTCAGQGYVCVHKAQCNNGVVNTNGASVLQAKTKKQYCNTRTEICCRIEISTLAGASDLQGSLGVGSGTYSGSSSSNTNRQGGLFVSSSQSGNNGFGAQAGSSQSGQNAFGAGQSGQGAFGAGQSGQSAFGAGQSGQSAFGSSQSGQSAFGSSQSGQAFGSRGSGSSFNAGASGTTGQAGFGAGSSTFNANRGSTASSFGQGTQGFGAQGTFGSGSVNKAVESSSSTFGSTTRGTGFGSSGTKFGAGFGVGSTVAPTTAGRFGGNEVVYKQTSQSNFVETDSFSSGSENTGIFRPGSGLKPGIPYLPPDNTNQGSNVVSSTAFPSTFVTPRPTTPRPTYLPPSPTTSAPGYLPPIGAPSFNTETRLPRPTAPPTYSEGELILSPFRPGPARTPGPAPPSEVPSGCAAALKCTPVEYCTAEGVISNTTVALTRDQEAFRVPLTDCKDLETGRVGKCCRDPYYSDPWPVNQLGKWVPNTFGGNDGKYTPDNRGSPSIGRPSVTSRPPAVTGSTLLNNYRSTTKPTPTFGPNQVTPGFPSVTQTSYAKGGQGQYEIRGQGQGSQAGQGQIGFGGQGHIGVGGQGSAGNQFNSQSQFSSSSFSQTQRGQGQGVTTGQGQAVTTGRGQAVTTGQGQVVQQGQGAIAQGGRGQVGFGSQVSVQEQAAFNSRDQSIAQSQQANRGNAVTTGQGQSVSQGFGQGVTQGFGQGVSQGFGQGVSQGFGQGVSQGFGQGVRQGSGLSVSQGGGFNVENEYSDSASRVFLSRYSAGGQCGLFNGQKPYGNRNENEVDFAEIPWQAMVLLQTNKSLLCGGVITRPDVVVTSASCIDGLQAKNVLIKGGEWKLGIDEEPLPFQIVQVKNILRHPYYKRGSLLNDAAILVLSENLRFAKNIYPICLPSAQDTLDAFYNGAGECIVTGWGKQVLQAHLLGSIMHSINVSLINPGECQAKIAQDYPHLLDQYDQDSCACGQPTNPVNNICRVDTGSALACTTDNVHWVFRGVYSWESGCQPGNQLAGFYKFDLEWYEWAIGLLESARFAQFSSSSSSSSQRFTSGVKGGAGGAGAGIKGGFGASFGGFGGQVGFGSGQFGQFSSKITKGTSSEGKGAFSGEVTSPISNSYSATYSEKKTFQSEPKIITYTTKPEIVTYTTKPEYFTFTTKPKLVTYTTKPQIVTYETSGSGTNPQYVAPGVTFNPTFSELVGQHKHNAACNCLNGKK
ncbi:hornerin-like isoform X2 [Cydia strobilella]|uniref:hornerin-like isoform X2 n=1 Tax=Cydia strobilella TaxID=1100964 RepID=UPI003006E8A3